VVDLKADLMKALVKANNTFIPAHHITMHILVVLLKTTPSTFDVSFITPSPM